MFAGQGREGNGQANGHDVSANGAEVETGYTALQSSSESDCEPDTSATYESVGFQLTNARPDNAGGTMLDAGDNLFFADLS